MENEKTEKELLQEHRDMLANQKTEVEADIEEAKQELTDLNGELRELKEQIRKTDLELSKLN
jgi:peptidoglycan hydrolase CwlO-like protein